MTRQLPPTAGTDPLLSITRHQLRQQAVSTPAGLRRELDVLERSDTSAPRNRPILAGSWSDAGCTAGRNLARILHDLGLLDDQTEE